MDRVDVTEIETTSPDEFDSDIEFFPKLGSFLLEIVKAGSMRAVQVLHTLARDQLNLFRHLFDFCIDVHVHIRIRLFVLIQHFLVDVKRSVKTLVFGAVVGV